jgi:hypothetical protein
VGWNGGNNGKSKRSERKDKMGCRKSFWIYFKEFEFKIKGFKYFKTEFDLGSNWDKFKVMGWRKSFQIYFKEFEFKIKGFKYFKTKFDLGSNWDNSKKLFKDFSNLELFEN